MSTDSSMSRVHDAFDLMDRLDRLDTEAELRSSLLGFLGTCGIEYFTITQLPQPCERVASHMLLTVWPQNWLTHYDRSAYYRNDPVVRHCFNTVEPFLWSTAPVDADVQPKARKVMGEAAENGMSDGLCIPIIDVGGFQAVVSMAGPRLQISPSERRALHLLGYYAHGAAIRISRQRRPAKRRSEALSPRERDVLTWLAIGRQANEVSRILGISEATVTTHLKRAKDKLGTTNTTHTVVEALRQHQIRV